MKESSSSVLLTRTIYLSEVEYLVDFHTAFSFVTLTHFLWQLRLRNILVSESDVSYPCDTYCVSSSSPDDEMQNVPKDSTILSRLLSWTSPVAYTPQAWV